VRGREARRASRKIAIIGFPHIALLVGSRGTLEVDTGMGPRNGPLAQKQEGLKEVKLRQPDIVRQRSRPSPGAALLAGAAHINRDQLILVEPRHCADCRRYRENQNIPEHAHIKIPASMNGWLFSINPSRCAKLAHCVNENDIYHWGKLKACPATDFC
jgi:hypothetical protein